MDVLKDGCWKNVNNTDTTHIIENCNDPWDPCCTSSFRIRKYVPSIVLNTGWVLLLNQEIWMLLLVNFQMSFPWFLFIYFCNSLYCLILISILNAEFYWVLREVKCMEKNGKYLERKLKSVNKHPVFGIHQILLWFWHSHCHYQDNEESQIYKNVGWCSKTFVH